MGELLKQEGSRTKEFPVVQCARNKTLSIITYTPKMLD